MFNAGWANSCGQELFTLGWIPCAVIAPPVVRRTSVTAPGGISDIERDDMDLFNLIQTVIASGALDAYSRRMH